MQLSELKWLEKSGRSHTGRRRIKLSVLCTTQHPNLAHTALSPPRTQTHTYTKRFDMWAKSASEWAKSSSKPSLTAVGELYTTEWATLSDSREVKVFEFSRARLCGTQDRRVWSRCYTAVTSRTRAENNTCAVHYTIWMQV